MRAVFRNHSTLLLVTLIFGVLSTLVLDFWAVDEVRRGTWVYELCSWVAFFFRLGTYSILFISCRLIAEELSGSVSRTVLLGVVWSLIGLFLAAIIWCHLAFSEEIYGSFHVVRFTPDRPTGYAIYANGQKIHDYRTLAEMILRDEVGAYTWLSAIKREAVGIVALSFFVALFLAAMAFRGRLKAAYYAPFVSYLFLTIYRVIFAPWSFTWGSDPWVGDALLGAMAYNALFFFWSTIWFGGLAGPAVWVNLIAMTNLVLLTFWTREEPQ